MSNEPTSAHIESLEARRLLAFATLNLSTGRVSLVGTAGDDVITVQLNAQTGQLDMTLNGQTESFARPHCADRCRCGGRKRQRIDRVQDSIPRGRRRRG